MRVAAATFLWRPTLGRPFIPTSDLFFVPFGRQRLCFSGCSPLEFASGFIPWLRHADPPMVCWRRGSCLGSYLAVHLRRSPQKVRFSNSVDLIALVLGVQRVA